MQNGDAFDLRDGVKNAVIRFAAPIVDHDDGAHASRPEIATQLDQNVRRTIRGNDDGVERIPRRGSAGPFANRQLSVNRQRISFGVSTHGGRAVEETRDVATTLLVAIGARRKSQSRRAIVWPAGGSQAYVEELSRFAATRK